MKMKTPHKKELSIWVVESCMLSPFAFILTTLLYLGINGQNMQCEKLAPGYWFQGLGGGGGDSGH